MFIYREDYVEILKKYIPVDVFGQCGPGLTCSRDGTGGHNSPQCNEMLERDYR